MARVWPVPAPRSWISGLLLGGSISLFTAGWHLAGIAVLVLGTAAAVHAWTLRLQ